MIDLENIIGNRRWVRRRIPFVHVHAREVFTAAFYAALARDFQAILDRGLSEQPAAGQFSRTIAGYDAYGISFDGATQGSLAVFLSPEWHALITGLFSLRGTGQINVGAHYHTVGSADGFIHNDFNPVWFPTHHDPQTCCFQSPLCDYKTGAGPLASADKNEVVRAVALIFYLCNDDRWAPGDGGETGLFSSAEQSVGGPSARVPPENNSIFLFECTPHSYHTFLANHRWPRSSIIMWAHRTKEDALQHWEDSALERWLL